MRVGKGCLAIWSKMGITAGAVILMASCTPRFNRTAPVTPVGPSTISITPDLAVQGGSAATGVTAHFHVTRVAIGGNIQRRKSSAPSGKSAQGGVQGTSLNVI